MKKFLIILGLLLSFNVQGAKFNQESCKKHVEFLSYTLDYAVENGAPKEFFVEKTKEFTEEQLKDFGFTRQEVTDIVNFVFKYAGPEARVESEKAFLDLYVKMYCAGPLGSKSI